MRTTLTPIALTALLLACDAAPLDPIEVPRQPVQDPSGDPAPDPTPDPEPSPALEDPVEDPAPEPAPEPEPEPCVYPGGGALNGVGDVLTPMRFTAVENGAAREVDLEQLYCEGAYSAYVFVMTAEWCPSCPSYAQALASRVDDILANDALLILVSLEDRFYTEPDSPSADAYFSGYFAAGARVGAGVLDPSGALEEMWQTVPNGFVVRASDMKVIAHQETSDYVLDYVALTADPERDWGNGAGAGNAPPVCAEGEDEAAEPNDTLAQAGPAPDAPGAGGAICGADPDWYAVTLEGDWRAELSFSHAEGDLDIELTNGNGERVQVAESATDDEILDGSGPGFLRVYGYNGATGHYGLRVTPR